MNTKVILVGAIVAIVAVAGIALALNGHSSEKDDGSQSPDLAGYWYTVDGEVYIEGVGVKNLLSDDCLIASGFTDIRINESNNNVFYGTIFTERMVGMYFDDGRITFKYPVKNAAGINQNETFFGVYKDGLIYGSTYFKYTFGNDEKACVVTYVLSRDASDSTKLVDLPDIAGKWNISESHALMGNAKYDINNGSLEISSLSNHGLFKCVMTLDTNKGKESVDLYGRVLNTSIHGTYYGHLIDPQNDWRWDFVLDGENISVQSVVRSNSSAEILTSVSCSFSKSDGTSAKEYPEIRMGIFYSDRSWFACFPGGSGTLIKSNTPFMINFTKQEGPCFSGTVIIDGTSFPSTGVIDTEGHITICYLAGTWVDFAYGDYRDGELEICASIYTNYLGQCARYVELEPMPANKFIEDTDFILGSWTVSSFASPDGTVETIFSPSIRQLPLYIKSIEDGIVHGYLFDNEFKGTYGPTSTGHGSIWADFMVNDILISFEIIATQNDLLFATFSFRYMGSDDAPHMCQAIYTKDNQYSPVPNHGVDVFDKDWVAKSVKIWDGSKLEDKSAENVIAKVERTQTGDAWGGLESFFKLTIESPIINSMTIRGAFYSVDVYGNGIANLYGLNSDCLSMNYYNGDLYIQGSIGYEGRLVAFSIVFVEKGSTHDPTFENKYYNLQGKTFEEGDFKLTVTNQTNAFVYGIIESEFDGKELRGAFTGIQMCIGGPVYIEATLLFDGDKVWDANIVIYADESNDVTSISFEAIWFDMKGNSNVARVIAKC